MKTRIIATVMSKIVTALATTAKTLSFPSRHPGPLALARTVVGIAVLSAPAALAQYTITDLGNLGGNATEESELEGNGINNNGRVVGQALTPGGSFGYEHAFLWTTAEGMQDLGTLPGTLESSASGINDNSQVVGYSYYDMGHTHAFLNSGCTMSDLGTPPGFTDSQANGINNSGQIVGLSFNGGSYGSHAFLYSGGVWTDLGTLPGGTTSVAYGINNNGQVVGTSDSAADEYLHAFLYSGGVMSDLNTMIPANSGWTLYTAFGINDNGQITGYGYNSANGDAAFLLTPTPQLSIARSGGNVVLSWNSPGYVLETTASLNPAVWTVMPGTSQNSPSVSPITNSQFFRLAPSTSGDALSFDGVASYVSVGAAPLSPPWTAEFWVNRQDAPNYSASLLGDGSTALKLEQFYFTREVGFTQFGVDDYTFNYSAPVNTWVHLAFVCNPIGIDSLGSVELYVNGVLQDSIVGVNIALPLDRIGYDDSGYPDYMKGLLDEVRIWNVVRTQAQIQADMNHSLPVPQANLVGYWRFDEGSGTCARDSSGQDNTGILENGPSWVVSTAPLVP
jgi:probable HAF family extracellular repeat protein